MMKKRIFLLSFWFLIFIRAVYGRETNGLCAGNPFPRFAAKDVYGNETGIEKLKGQVLIVAIKFMDPEDEDKVAYRKQIVDFYDSRKSKGLEILRIVSKKGVPFIISKAFVEKRSRQSLEKFKEGFKVIIDWDHALKKLLKMDGSPLVYVIDKTGIIRIRKEGNLMPDDGFKEVIDKLLNEEHR